MGVYPVPLSDAIAEFADAMRRRGLIPPDDLVADGQLHRCRVEGARPSKRDGAYILHFDGRPAGGFQNWKDGAGWEGWRYTNGTTIWTPAETEAFETQVAARKKAEAEKRRRLTEVVRREAIERFDNAGSADPRHPYLVRKQVKPHCLRQSGSELLVPRFDIVTGEIVNLQKILSNGEKRNLTGGRVDGTWFILGKPEARGTILVGEGFATAATSHEVAGYPAIVTFGSTNLMPTAIELRKQYPQARIIVLADDDWKKPGNPGLTEAMEAARAVDAFLAVPTFGSDRADDDTDFNDMWRLAGADAVKAAVENATKPANASGKDKAVADSLEEASGRGPKQADILIALAQAAELFHSPNGIGFADLDINGHRETWPVRGKSFKRWLARCFFEATKGAPNSEALQSALNVIDAKADFDTPVRAVHVRVGGLDGKLYLDLGDDTWRAVEIDETGWRVTTGPRSGSVAPPA